ncbi:hypothetical protein IAD21_05739 [Abditibacteriota bacterium]|nr:hypothetical protein IAD21_05739 [Abditibacteriota bacterium]
MKVRCLLSFLLVVVSICTGVVQANPAISGRKIGPVEITGENQYGTLMSRDGQWLTFSGAEEGTGIRCSLFNRRTHKSWMPDFDMRPIAFSRDGRRLFVWCDEESLPGLKHQSANNSYIAVYNLARHRFTRIFSDVHEPDNLDGLESGVVSRDGRRLTCTSYGGWIYVFDTRTGKLLWKRCEQKKNDASTSITLNKDGSYFLRTSDDEGEKGFAIASTRTGRIVPILRHLFATKGRKDSLSDGAFAPRGDQAAVYASDTKEWVFCDLRSGKIQWKMHGWAHDIATKFGWQWSPNARFVGVSTPEGFQVRDALTGHVLQSCPTLKDRDVTFSLDGTKVYSVEDDKTGFGTGTVLWQWRLFPTASQRRADARVMKRLHKQEERFALSPQHIDQSLLIAARRGDAKRIAFLLNRGANIETRDASNLTPLGAVANWSGAEDGPQEYLTCAQLLIARGADVNSRNTEGATPLENAAGWNDTDIAKLLIAHGANVNARGGSILAGAAANDSELTTLLLEHGARVNGDASGYGLPTALHAAIDFGQVENVRILLQHKANPNARGKDGTTPLMELFSYPTQSRVSPQETLDIAHLLIEYGAKVDNLDSDAHKTLIASKDPIIKRALQKAGITS